MNSTTVNMDTVTNVIIDGNEYERWRPGNGKPKDNQVILFAQKLKRTSTVTSKNKPFTYYAQVGSAFGGEKIDNAHSLKFCLYESSTPKIDKTGFSC